MDSEVYPSWAHTVEEVIDHHNVDLSVGLSDAEAEVRLQKHGHNELKKPPSPSMWALILEQFDDTLVKVRQESANCHLPCGVQLLPLH